MAKLIRLHKEQTKRHERYKETDSELVELVKELRWRRVKLSSVVKAGKQHYLLTINPSCERYDLLELDTIDIIGGADG
jgi:hypothetical protein